MIFTRTEAFWMRLWAFMSSFVWIVVLQDRWCVGSSWFQIETCLVCQGQLRIRVFWLLARTVLRVSQEDWLILRHRLLLRNMLDLGLSLWLRLMLDINNNLFFRWFIRTGFLFILLLFVLLFFFLLLIFAFILLFWSILHHLRLLDQLPLFSFLNLFLLLLNFNPKITQFFRPTAIILLYFHPKQPNIHLSTCCYFLQLIKLKGDIRPMLIIFNNGQFDLIHQPFLQTMKRFAIKPQPVLL